MTIPPFVDALVMLLLAVTIYYSMKLNKRLSNLRANKGEFEALALQITQAAMQAEACIVDLKNAASEADQIISGSMRKAELIRDEITFMVERGELAVTRLDKVLGEAQKQEKTAMDRGVDFKERAANLDHSPIKREPILGAGDFEGDSQNIELEASSAPYYPESEKPSPLSSDKDLAPRSKEEEELLKTLRSMR